MFYGPPRGIKTQHIVFYFLLVLFILTKNQKKQAQY